MFTHTAYEALYQYLGLSLHGNFIEIITSHQVLIAVVLMTFAFLFFTTSIQFFSRYMPGSIVRRKSVPLSRYVKILLCLVIGVSILKVESHTGVKNFGGDSWHDNPYVSRESGGVQEEYRVSLIFNLISRTAEETAALVNRIVDRIFTKTHSQLEAPNFFYKAVLYAGSATIKDADLKESVDFYTSECIERILPLLAGGKDRLVQMFADGFDIDNKLAQFKIAGGSGGQTCLDAKNEVRERLARYAQDEAGMFPGVMTSYIGSHVGEGQYQNLQISSALVEHYMDGRENILGIQKGSQPPDGAARIFQYLNRVFSFDGAASLWGIGDEEAHGSALAAKRAQEFSENLIRAPHVAGFIKMALIAVFPWLVFPIVAGRWRVLIYWFLVYLSVLLWAPIWTLLYHIVLNISLSTGTMEAFGHLADGISLYSAKLISSRMNYMFAVYSWLQLLIGLAFTGGLLWILRPVVSDSEPDRSPDFVDDSGSILTGGTGVANRIRG